MDKNKVLKQINKELDMIFYDNSLTPEDRGILGENVIIRMSNYWAKSYGNTLIKKGFIFPQGVVLPSRTSTEKEPVTEIDCLIVTPHRILVVEIKTIYGHIKFYEDNNMEISYNKHFTGEYDKKNYLRQNEMHARHLYYHLHTILPQGLPKYIQPIIVMVGNSTIIDERSAEDKKAQIITTATDFIKTLEKMFKPFENSIDLRKVATKLNKIEVKGEEGMKRLLRSQDFVKEEKVV